MRPDYTLSIWPGEITEQEAEQQELIIHIHFDAKYRLDKVLLENASSDDYSETELDMEKQQQELGIYKRADLLKMHAYKDAIRRTGGAYVLYPGTENKELRGFHEIVPGLGAFSIRPGHWREDSIYLKQFLAEVKAHLLDRTSDREKLSYYEYDIHREANSTMVMESLPEAEGENRDFLPDETYVIVAYFKSSAHLNWILEHHLYNMRAGDDKGSIELDKKLMNARYLLLHNNHEVLPLIRIRKKGPKVYTRKQLINMGYPPYQKGGTIDTEREQREADRIYLLFELFKDNNAEKELRGYRWDPEQFNQLQRAYTISLPNILKKRL